MAAYPYLRGLYKIIAGVVFILIVISLIVQYSGWGIPSLNDYYTGPPLECAIETVTQTLKVIETVTQSVEVFGTVTQTVEITKTVLASAQAPSIRPPGRPSEGWNKAHDEDYLSLLTEGDLRLVEQLRNYTLPTNVDPQEHRPDSAVPVFRWSIDTRQKLFTDLYSIGSPSGPASWEQYINSISPHFLAPLTHITQHYLYKHQHPTAEECRHNTKFLVMPSYSYGAGLGSVLHGGTHGLSTAIRSGRVLIYDQQEVPGTLFSGDGKDCPGSKLGLDCFFEPITSCSWSDVRLPGPDGDDGESNAIFFRQYSDNPEAKHPFFGYQTRNGDIPPVLGLLLKEWEGLASGGAEILMSPDARKVWWRGQGAGYVARLNPWALGRLKEMRLTNKAERVGIRGNKRDIPIPFPLPHHSVAIHIRHGDKDSEMFLVPFSHYLSKAADIINANPARGMLSKTVFLSTEDPLVIDEMLNFTAADTIWDGNTGAVSNLQWTFFYTAGVPRLNGGPNQEVIQGKEVETTLLHLGELMLSLESGTWVGTRGSNWCRLVDELAQVWVGGAGTGGGSPGLFLEVGNPDDWLNYQFK